MNAAYNYNSKEVSACINSRIYFQLQKHQWSVKTLSDKTGIPYETLKKLLSLKTENTSFHNIARIALAFECNLGYFTGNMPENSVSGFVPTVYSGDVGSSYHTCENPIEKSSIPVVSSDTDYSLPLSGQPALSNMLSIANYPKDLQKEIDYGIQISSYCYHPVYYENDILLISRNRPPKLGEIAVFSHNGRLFIRLLTKTKARYLLSAVNGLGSDISVTDFSEWSICGYVVGVHRL